jgi:hypothetical protein
MPRKRCFKSTLGNTGSSNLFNSKDRPIYVSGDEELIYINPNQLWF